MNPKRETSSVRLGVVAILLATLCGCGSQQVGIYESTIRIKRGVVADEALQTDLEKAIARLNRVVEKLHIKSGGRYRLQNTVREFDGDWWIADDGRLATRTTHQNGKSLGKLTSEGADRHWEIGSDGNLYRHWNGQDSNLELVLVKQ